MQDQIILSNCNAGCIHAWMSLRIDIIMKFEFLISIDLVHLMDNGVRLLARVYSPTSANEILSNLKTCFYLKNIRIAISFQSTKLLSIQMNK